MSKINTKKTLIIILIILCIILILGYFTGAFKKTIHLSVNADEIEHIEIYGTGGRHILKDDELILEAVKLLEGFDLVEYKDERVNNVAEMSISLYLTDGTIDIFSIYGGHIRFNDTIYEAKFFTDIFYVEIDKFLVEHEFISIDDAPSLKY